MRFEVFAFEITGYLKDFQLTPDRLSFVIYPFYFEPDPAKKPLTLFEVRRASLEASEVAHFVGEEVSIEATSEILRIYSHMNDEMIIRAESVRWSEAGYSLNDFADRVVGLEQELRKARDEELRLKRHLEKVDHAVSEMVRRSEIKSSANEFLEAQQTEILKLLHRIQAYLKG